MDLPRYSPTGRALLCLAGPFGRVAAQSRFAAARSAFLASRRIALASVAPSMAQSKDCEVTTSTARASLGGCHGRCIIRLTPRFPRFLVMTARPFERIMRRPNTGFARQHSPGGVTRVLLGRLEAHYGVRHASANPLSRRLQLSEGPIAVISRGMASGAAKPHE